MHYKMRAARPGSLRLNIRVLPRNRKEIKTKKTPAEIAPSLLRYLPFQVTIVEKIKSQRKVQTSPVICTALFGTAINLFSKVK